MSERKVKDAIFAQRDAPRKARISWIPASHKSPPSRTRLVAQPPTDRPGLADAEPRESSHDPAPPSQSASEPSTNGISDVMPAPTSPSALHPSAESQRGGPPHPTVMSARDAALCEPPPTMRGFFDALPEMPPPPELMPTTSAQAAIESFTQAAEALSEIRAIRHSRLERDLVELAGAIAERVLGRELAMDPTLLAALARDGIAALADRESVTVRFSTDTPDEAKTQLQEAITNRAPGCKVIFDRELIAGSCVVESAQGFVDESVTTRLDIVMEQLGFRNGGLT